jgi:hypothetical protein
MHQARRLAVACMQLLNEAAVAAENAKFVYTL